MTAQEKELNQLKQDIYDDVEDLVEKYMSIVGWDVPENDEDEARKKIIETIKDKIEKLEKDI